MRVSLQPWVVEHVQFLNFLTVIPEIHAYSCANIRVCPLVYNILMFGKYA